MSGGALPSDSAHQLSGQSRMASTNLPVSGSEGRSAQDRVDLLLRKVEKAVSGGQSLDSQQKDGFIQFLKSWIPHIHELIFPQDFDEVTRFTRRCVKLSRQIEAGNTETSQMADDHHQMARASDGTGLGVAPSPGLSSLGATKHGPDYGLPVQMEEPSNLFHDSTMPSIVQVDAVLRGSYGTVTGDSSAYRQPMTWASAPKSAAMTCQPRRTVHPPKPSTMTYAQYTNVAAKPCVCTELFTMPTPTVNSTSFQQASQTFTEMTDVSLASLGSASVRDGQGGVQQAGLSEDSLAHSPDEFGGYLPLNPNMAIPQDHDTDLPPWFRPSGEV